MTFVVEYFLVYEVNSGFSSGTGAAVIRLDTNGVSGSIKMAPLKFTNWIRINPVVPQLEFAARTAAFAFPGSARGHTRRSI